MLSTAFKDIKSEPQHLYASTHFYYLILPHIVRVFTECNHILDLKNSAVVQCNRAVPSAENLVADIADKNNSRLCIVVVERSHCHFKAAVRRCELPRLHPVVFIFFKVDFADFVSLAV